MDMARRAGRSDNHRDVQQSGGRERGRLCDHIRHVKVKGEGGRQGDRSGWSLAVLSRELSLGEVRGGAASSTIQGMRTRTVYLAGVVLGLTLSLAVWLLTYRVWDVVEYIDPTGRHFHPSERVQVQPWWSVPATVAVLMGGVGASVWLLPGHRGLIRRVADSLAKDATDHSSSPA
jgi:hypothetical protein